MVLRRFPDVQRYLIDDLQTLAGTGHTGIQTPAQWGSNLPFIRIMRRGGPSTRLTDKASVDIDVFDSTYTAAELLAEQVRLRLVGPPPSVIWFDLVECTSAPVEAPSGDGTIRRFTAGYQIESRQILVPDQP